MTYTQWLAELKSRFDVAEEFELANAIYSFQDSYAEGLTPAEAYERFDQWACEDAA